MRKLCRIILFILCGIPAFSLAQENKFSLKATLLSYRFYFEDENDPYNFLGSLLENRFEFPALSLLIKDKKQNLHELELFNFYRSREDIEGNRYKIMHTTTSFQVGYSFDWFFLKNKDLAFKPFIGGGTEFLYQNDFFEPTDMVASYPIRYQFLNTYFQLTPGAHYQPFEKFYFQLTVPVSWLIYGHRILNIYNDTLTENQRRSAESYRQIAAYIPARLGLRLAVGYVF